MASFYTPVDRTTDKPSATGLGIQFRVESGEQRGRIVEIRSNYFTIGSSKNCQLRLRAPDVRREHCAVSHGLHGTTVMSLAPSATINGKPFSKCTLRDGDVLELGSFRLAVISGASAAEFQSGETTAPRPAHVVAAELDSLAYAVNQEAGEQPPTSLLPSATPDSNEASAQLVATTETLCARIDHLESLLSSHQSAEIEDLKEQTRSLEQERNQFEGSLNQCVQELDETRSQIQELTEALSTERTEHAAQHEELMAAVEQARIEYEQIKERLSDGEAERSTLEQSLNEQQELVANLQAEISAWEERGQAWEENEAAMREAIEEAKATIEQLQSEQGENSELVEQWEQQKSEYEEQLTALREEMSEERTQLQETQDKLNEQLEELQQELGTTQEQHSQEEQEWQGERQQLINDLMEARKLLIEMESASAPADSDAAEPETAEATETTEANEESAPVSPPSPPPQSELAKALLGGPATPQSVAVDRPETEQPTAEPVSEPAPPNLLGIMGGSAPSPMGASSEQPTAEPNAAPTGSLLGMLGGATSNQSQTETPSAESEPQTPATPETTDTESSDSQPAATSEPAAAGPIDLGDLGGGPSLGSSLGGAALGGTGDAPSGPAGMSALGQSLLSELQAEGPGGGAPPADQAPSSEGGLLGSLGGLAGLDASTSASMSDSDSAENDNVEIETDSGSEETASGGAAAGSSVSAADVLKRMGHGALLDEADNAPIEPVKPIQPTPTPQPPRAGEEEDEEAIDDYMSRLLRRVRGQGEEDEPVQSSAPSQAATPAPKASSENNEAEASPTPRQTTPTNVPLKASEFTPSRRAPEAADKMNAMRELANNSARTAITTAKRKKHSSFALTILSIILVSGGLGIGLLGMSIVMKSWTLGALGVTFLAGGIVAGVKTFGQWASLLTSRRK